MDLNQIITEKIAPLVDRAEARLKADKVVRRTVKGIIAKREVVPEENGFHVIVDIGKKHWQHTFNDIDNFCSFLQVGEVVAVTVDEYRDVDGSPLYRDVLSIKHLETETLPA